MPVRLGFIGIGGIAGAHLNACKKFGFPVTAAFDVDQARLKERQKEYGITHLLGSPQELADHPDVDAVGRLLSRQHVHLDGIRAACNAGKPLFTEKPLTRTHKDALEAVELVEKAGIVAQVGFVRRYCAEWGTFARLMNEGVIGNPIVWWMAGGGPGPGSSFFNQRDQGGGPMVDGMVHNYDFCRWVWGEPTRVLGSCANLHPTNTALDTCTGIPRVLQRQQAHDPELVGHAAGRTLRRIPQRAGPEGYLLLQRPGQPAARGSRQGQTGLLRLQDRGRRAHTSKPTSAGTCTSASSPTSSRRPKRAIARRRRPSATACGRSKSLCRSSAISSSDAFAHGRGVLPTSLSRRHPDRREGGIRDEDSGRHDQQGQHADRQGHYGDHLRRAAQDRRHDHHPGGQGRAGLRLRRRPGQGPRDEGRGNSRGRRRRRRRAP